LRTRAWERERWRLHATSSPVAEAHRDLLRRRK
jgi:hypothetical protein